MTNEERHQLALNRYNANIKHCLNCNKPLPYEQRDQTFCSLSCAGEYNGKKLCNIRHGFEIHHFSEEERKERARLRAIKYYQEHKCGIAECIYCGNSFVKTNNQQTVCHDCRDKINSCTKVSDDIEYHRTSDHSTVHRNLMKNNGWDVKPSDVVRHIDGDKRNNSDNNLMLLDRSDHIKLHRFIGIERFKGSTETLQELTMRFLLDTQTPYGMGKYPTDDEIASIS